MQQYEINAGKWYGINSVVQLENAWVLQDRSNKIHVISQGRMRQHSLSLKGILSCSPEDTACIYTPGGEFYLDEYGKIVERPNAAKVLRPNQNYFATYIDLKNYDLTGCCTRCDQEKLAFAIAAGLMDKEGLLFVDEKNRKTKLMPFGYNKAIPSNDGQTFFLYEKYENESNKIKIMIIDNPLLD